MNGSSMNRMSGRWESGVTLGTAWLLTLSRRVRHAAGRRFHAVKNGLERSSSMVCLVVGLMVALAHTGPLQAAPPDRPTFGAIRWDGWFKGNPWQRNLDPKQWHDRVPFYGKVILENRVEVCGDSQETMDREIGYAKAAGLDYWAFLHYHPASWRGADQYNYGLKLYLSSRRKAEVGFCVILYPLRGDEWTKQTDFAAGVVKEASYQKVADNRPLIYLLTWGEKAMPEDVWGPPEKSRAAIDALRHRIMGAGLKNPYIVVQGMDAQRSARYVEQLGLDAVSSYANWTGGGYADLAAENRKFWESCRATGKQVVPLVSVGWDPRPRKQPGGPQPTPQQLRDHVRSALDWATNHRSIAPAQTIIAYAWNESDEGGWLVPTHSAGTSRLDAVREALSTPAAVAPSGDRGQDRGQGQGQPRKPGAKGDRPLVGASYFAGWWRPNKWNYDPAVGDWRARFPQRVPLLGEYNEPSTMDKEIVAAAEHGVDFFLILWYYNGPDDSREREKNARFLNEGLKTFVKSPEAHRMRFAIEYCNHQPYQVKTADDWNHCIKTWVAAMRHPSYLRVGGKLVFKVHSWHHFWDENGKDATACRARLDGLRKAVREAGLSEMIIGCGIPSGEKIAPGHPAGDLFDFTGTYMEVPDLPQREADYPYEKLAEFARPTRAAHAKDKIPYVPYLGAGFNARPWPDHRARFAIPTKDEWMRELRTTQADLERLENLGFPLPDGRRQKALTIYAWNEFGEGGFLAPTQRENYMKLQAIRDVFGRANNAGSP
jgi:hypothetical protein